MHQVGSLEGLSQSLKGLVLGFLNKFLEQLQ
jgi:hypothetical protein